MSCRGGWRSGRIQFGGWSALQETAFGAVTFVGLTMVTFGGYASYTFGSAIWGGYRELGILGALNALNPLYQLAKSAVDTFAAAEREDWEAVGQGGVNTGVAAVGVVGAVAGIAGAVRGAVAGAKGAAAGAAARGVGGLDDLVRFRSELGLAQGEGTLARLDVGGRSFYGINAHGQPVTMRQRHYPNPR